MPEATVNYVAQDIEPSLFRNGEVLTYRDRDGSDDGSKGVRVEASKVNVMDARVAQAAGEVDLARSGFELLGESVGAGVDFLKHGNVVRDLYPECEQLLASATGAQAFAFDHNIRYASGKQNAQRIAGGQTVQGPAHMVHGDYTLRSARARLQALSAAPGGNDTLKQFLATGETAVPAELADAALAGGRFAIINVWRNIAPEPVVRDPLALCDGRSVSPEELVVFEIHYKDRVGENYFARRADSHAWYRYPEIRPDEALLIKQWDSAGTLAASNGDKGAAAGDPHCTFSFHTAYTDPAQPEDAPERRSIEVRCAVLY